MGLFSVLDVILEKPMAEALTDVHVTKDVYEALVNKNGKLAAVMNFIRQYETANWSEVSRLMLLSKIDMKDVYNSYVDALVWYRKIYS
jgi:EAL and modified HD-GYP domain-containing signal transduction protein